MRQQRHVFRLKLETLARTRTGDLRAQRLKGNGARRALLPRAIDRAASALTDEFTDLKAADLPPSQNSPITADSRAQAHFDERVLAANSALRVLQRVGGDKRCKAHGHRWIRRCQLGYESLAIDRIKRNHMHECAIERLVCIAVATHPRAPSPSR